jgi:hypothetical protein
LAGDEGRGGVDDLRICSFGLPRKIYCSAIIKVPGETKMSEDTRNVVRGLFIIALTVVAAALGGVALCEGEAF